MIRAFAHEALALAALALFIANAFVWLAILGG